MGVTVLFYKLFQFKDDLAAILKRYCCHSNVNHKFILSTIRLLPCSLIQIDLLILITPKNNYWSEMYPWSEIFRFICPLKCVFC